MHSRQLLTSPLTDEELLELFNQGLDCAFDELIKRYKSKIFGFIYLQIQQQAQDAEDLTQDTFVQLYQTAPKFKGESRFSSYLFGIAKNLVLNYFRTKSRLPNIVDTQPFNTDTAESGLHERSGHLSTRICTKVQIDENGPEAVSGNHHNQEILRHAIAKLTNEERQLLFLHDRESFTYEQISEILDLKIGTVRSRLHNTRKKLMIILKRGR
jgi:RNA polymerase sigma-70 factor (ECF subfamily)